MIWEISMQCVSPTHITQHSKKDKALNLQSKPQFQDANTQNITRCISRKPKLIFMSIRELKKTKKKTGPDGTCTHNLHVISMALFYSATGPIRSDGFQFLQNNIYLTKKEN